MGFLDHSTNNIIIDAVLTDEGRKILAENSSNFNITQFALADDEVDYTLIQKFGRSVGKEKITKNTPVFEASTVADYALKHKLKRISGRHLFMPSFTLENASGQTGLSGNILSFNKSVPEQQSRTINLISKMNDTSRQVPDSLRDNAFFVYVPNRFLSVQGETPIPAIDNDKVDIYLIDGINYDDQNRQVMAPITLNLRTGNLTDTAFSIYSDSTNPSKITSIVSIIGEDTGIRKDFTVHIDKV